MNFKEIYLQIESLMVLIPPGFIGKSGFVLLVLPIFVYVCASSLGLR